MDISIQQKTRNNYKPSFKGPLDSVVTQTLMTIDTNQMINSTLVDVGAMVIPRTYIDTKKRNQFAGFETFFREITGTAIMCLSAGSVAYAVAAVHNKIQNKEIDIKPNMWVTNTSWDTMKESWVKSDKNINKYVQNVFSNISGLDGNKTAKWNNIDWNKVEWFDDPSWEKIKWKDSKWANTANRAKNSNEITNILTELIEDKNADRHDVKKVFGILEHRITNALKTNRSIDLSIGNKKHNATLKNIIRDTHDLGKNIFNNNVDLIKAEKKLKSMNLTKSVVGVSIVAVLGLTNQYINRMITKKRTGSDNFVGDSDFRRKEKNEKNKHNPKLIGLKALASAGMLALSFSVMKIKKPSDFLKKLEFKEHITSGNAIKTLYTATLIGRFLAARDETELRESCTRDYFAFLNWLVFGGFVAKGVGKMLDSKKANLFNGKELKSHLEIAAQGKKFAEKNIWKLNLAHTSGLLYSGLALGCAIPLINIFITNHAKKKNNSLKSSESSDKLYFSTSDLFYKDNEKTFSSFTNFYKSNNQKSIK